MTFNIVFTGGGTAGHVTPNVALISIFKRDGWHIDYIGSPDGIEKNMITAIDVPFYGVSSGKLRRYFSWKNFFDPFKILLGIGQSYRLLRRLKPGVVFSKGGFVAFPVVVGAWLNRIPIVAHESDMSPGLANRLSFPFVNKICVTFAAAKDHFKQQDKIEVTGTPIREELLTGDKDKGLALCGFTPGKPCLLVIGGSQGAIALNACVRESLDLLTQSFQIIHLCGKGKLDKTLVGRDSYCQFEYANETLPHFLAASDLVISRAGANSLYEILASAKPHILVPLSEQVSRGDQVQNARYFQQQGISTVLREDALTKETLCAAIEKTFAHRDSIIKKIKVLKIESGTPKIVKLLKEQVHV